MVGGDEYACWRGWERVFFLPVALYGHPFFVIFFTPHDIRRFVCAWYQ
jgi:hypothetical protein